MASPMLAVQAAIVSLLRSGVSSFGGRVYDRAPQSVAFPFAEVGNMEQIEDSGTEYDGCEVVAFVEIYSRGIGKVEAHTLSEASRLLLHSQPLALSGARHVGTMCRSINITDEGDGLTTRARMDIRVLIDAT